MKSYSSDAASCASVSSAVISTTITKLYILLQNASSPCYGARKTITKRKARSQTSANIATVAADYTGYCFALCSCLNRVVKLTSEC